MKKILLCLFALLLLCGCAEKQAQIPEQAQIGTIHSVSPSYETRYFARTMDIWKTAETIAPFQTAYEQVLPALTETSKSIPEGDVYFFQVFHRRDGESSSHLFLRLVDDGKGCWLELTDRKNKPTWTRTYALSRAAAQPLFDLFAGEPTGKPHIEGHPNGRVVSILERIEKGWPIFEGKVLSVSDQVKEFSLHEELRYGWLYREFTVEVAECYNGDLKEGDKLTYRVFGGETDDYSFSVENAPQVAVGDYVVVAAPEHSFATAYNVFPATEVDLYGYPAYTFTPPAGFFHPSHGLLQNTYFTYYLYRYCDCLRYELSLAAENPIVLPERVTDRELQELELQYPYRADFFPTLSRSAITFWEFLQGTSEFDGLVVLDFTGEFRRRGIGSSNKFYEGPELEALPAGQGGAGVLFARVEEVLIGCEWLQVGDLVPVVVGGTLTDTNAVLSLLPGQHFVCFVQETEDREIFQVSGGLGLYLDLLYHLTDNDVVFYHGSSYNTILSDCSGMYLPAFTELIREKLFSAR